MNLKRPLCVVLILAFIIAPLSVGAVFAADPIINTDKNTTVSDTPEGVYTGSNKFGYLTVDSVDYQLIGTGADITLKYKVDSWIEFLVYVLGKENLKQRVMSIANYPDDRSAKDVTFKHVDLNTAIISVKDIVMDNGDGSYWFYQHEFGTTIPKVTFRTQAETVKTYTNIKTMERGFGYFS